MAGLAILAAAACTKTEKVENINRGGQVDISGDKILVKNR